MNIIGKIFVFAVFVMSLVLMTFAGAVFMSHTNWQAEIDRRPEECRLNQKPGYKYLLEQAESERKKLVEQIGGLTRQIGESEQARDQVIARLQSALAEKAAAYDKERDEVVKLREKETKLLDELAAAQTDLKKVAADVETLRDQVRQQQQKVDQQVDRAAKIAGELQEAKSFLAVAEERKAQLEKQVANARVLLKQSGLSLDSLPADQLPALDGDVIAVADNSIQVSIGADDGLRVGAVLEVYREGRYLGRAVVRAVRPDHAVAELVRDFARGIVQRGDKVTTKLKA